MEASEAVVHVSGDIGLEGGATVRMREALDRTALDAASANQNAPLSLRFIPRDLI